MNILLRIKELLKRRNWTIYKLSKLSGVSQSTLSNLFKRNNAPTISTLESICKTFGITLSQFFSNDDVFSLDAEQKNILENWGTLTSEQKKIILQLINNMK